MPSLAINGRLSALASVNRLASASGQGWSCSDRSATRAACSAGVEVGEVHPPAGVGELEELADHVFGAQVSLYQQGAGFLDGTAEPAHLGPLCDMGWLPSLVCTAIPARRAARSQPRTRSQRV